MGNRREEKRRRLKRIIIIEAVIVVILLAALAISWIKGAADKIDEKPDVGKVSDEKTEITKPQATPSPTPTEIPKLTEEELKRQKEEEEKKKREALITEKLAEVELLSAMYDYDKAAEALKEIEGYELEERITKALTDIEAKKAACVVWQDNTKISHLFVHSLIVDTDRAFGKGSSQPDGYNRYMTTVGEFNKMLEQMYAKGYVLISVHDIAKVTEQPDGTKKLVKQDILLPEGKEPFVLSQDDVNYYRYMEGDGFAERLVIGEDGIPTCEYIDKDGNVLYGEYDVLPIVDRFVKEHPDFSYRGAKGILAVTGYEGALGYDTGHHMYDLDNPEEAEKLKEQQRQAKEVADAIKADGWEFASHSYTHTNMTNNTINKVVYDTDKWENEVQPILGDTDIYIYPFGADICDWRGYKGEKFECLKKAGFWYFCNVDSARYWIQLHDNYFRMGRINADGERMFKTPEKLTYFFDVNTVFDKTRKTPIG